MQNQLFSERNFRSLVSPIDFYHYEINRIDLDIKINEVYKAINEKSYKFSTFTTKKINGKVCFLASTFIDQLALRKINDNIRTSFKVKQNDRDTIIKQVVRLIKDEIPKFIIKVDISGFYESIDRSVLMESIESNYILSFKTKELIRNIFYRSNLKGEIGLPRGLSISSSLSELYMRGFDRKVKTIDGIYFYARYVDDIIVFAYSDGEEILKKLEKCLPQGLTLNNYKTQVCEIKCKQGIKCKRRCECQITDYHKISYLGYQFLIPTVPSENSRKNIRISISPKKIKRIKSRIIYSLLDYSKKRDLNLLEKRIRFLTGNYVVKRVDNFKSNLRAGIYYSYQEITDKTVLEELDNFLRKSINCKNGSLARKLDGKLNKNEKNKLSMYSFKSGYNLRRTSDFTRYEIKQIMECW